MTRKELLREEKNFRILIFPLKEGSRASDGKWDWRVTVQRLKDGMTKTTKVSGGWQVAENYAHKLMTDLL